MDLINTAKTWIIVGAVLILVIEVIISLNKNTILIHSIDQF